MLLMKLFVFINMSIKINTEIVEETKFRVLQHICCPQKNFKNYRVILKVYGTESKVMIPIFSVFLKDCFFRLKPCVEGCTEAEKELKVTLIAT